MIIWETLKISEQKNQKKRELINSFLVFIFCCVLIVALSFVFIIAFSGINIHDFLKILLPLLIILVVVTCLVTYYNLKERSYNMCVELNLSDNCDIKGIFSNPGALLNKINTKVEGGTFIMYLYPLTNYDFCSKFNNSRIVSKNGKIYFTAKILQKHFYYYYLGSEGFMGKGYKNSDDFKKDLEENLNFAIEKLLELKSIDELVLNSNIK